MHVSIGAIAGVDETMTPWSVHPQSHLTTSVTPPDVMGRSGTIACWPPGAIPPRVQRIDVPRSEQRYQVGSGIDVSSRGPFVGSSGPMSMVPPGIVNPLSLWTKRSIVHVPSGRNGAHVVTVTGRTAG